LSIRNAARFLKLATTSEASNQRKLPLFLPSVWDITSFSPGCARTTAQAFNLSGLSEKLLKRHHLSLWRYNVQIGESKIE
jgi:hypothetical protein